MGILLKNGRLLDLETGELHSRDVLVEGDRISRIGEDIDPASHQVHELNGNVIVPGFIDMHVHLRDPGLEYKETIETGTRSAAAGGFTTIACMPNTKPILDNPELMRYIYDTTNKTGSCKVLPYAAITRGERGEELTDMEALKEAGAVGFTDDGVGVQSGGMMRSAMERAKALGLPIVIHAEDESLSGKGCMNEGDVSKRLGLPGIPGVAESVHVARDALLAELTGVHLHVCHISDASAVDVVRWAKGRGIRITAEVTPHHLLLTDEGIDGTDANWKVNPPLRTEKDRLACLEGLLDGTIDMIATDHAPHSEEEKRRAFQVAPFGFVGLETAFPLLYTELVEKAKLLTLQQLVKKMATAPAEVFNLPGGTVAEGGLADLVVVNLEEERVIDPATFASKGRNTPFAGWRAKGWPVLTICDGKVTFDRTNSK
ncbi:dihydroorotase [Effusibacillus lacus]|uniref:Dihydroorotase n=1 Tax=Effusibacillus lacus TaxID=1348429 RepID=A0A292YP57_9BACL|nr:dihydroorotase [Effusibacillus lacus]TCS75644.1 dihydroorotase [Effusibacillus lacus]GAX90966.1 dihydroorotase [Effusibacillus lacus]